MAWSKLAAWGAGQPSERWEGQEAGLPESGCGTERWAVCCDGQGGAALLGSAGEILKVIRVTHGKTNSRSSESSADKPDCPDEVMG